MLSYERLLFFIFGGEILPILLFERKKFDQAIRGREQPVSA
jgi:hypothetical protein